MPRASTKKKGPVMEFAPKKGSIPPKKRDPEPEPIEATEDLPGEDETGSFTIDTDARKNPRAEKLPETEFWDFMAQWPTPDDLMVYVYRLEPVIKRKAQGLRARPVTYIDKVPGRITREWLIQRRGSGLYNIRMTDQGRTGKATRQVCMTNSSINEWDKFPPVIDDYTELVDCEQNRSFIAGLLAQKEIARDADGAIINYSDKQSTERNQLGAPHDNLKTAFDFAERMVRQSQQQQPPASKVEEHAGIKAVDTMAAMLLKAQEKPATDSGMMPLVLALIADSRAQQTQMMNMMLKMNERPEPAPQQQGGLLNGLKDLAEVLKTMNDIRPAETTWMSVLEKVAPSFAPVIAAGISAQMGRPAATPAVQQPQQTGAVVPHETHIPQSHGPIAAAYVPTEGSQGIPVSEPIPASASTQTETSAGMPSPEEIVQIGGTIARFMQNGATGSDFAGMILGSFGMVDYKRLAALGVPTMKLALQSQPQIWVMLSAMPIDQFLEDFVAFGQPEPEEASNAAAATA